MKPEKVAHIFSEELLLKCVNFTKAVFPTSRDEYSSRGQNNTSLVKSQNTLGKVGEEIAYMTYYPHFTNLTKPDYEIYDKKHKSWTPDLIDDVSGIRLAVKSKDRFYADKYGPSWTFETTDKKIFGKDLDSNQYVCMVVVDFDNYIGRVEGCIRLQWLHDNNLFEELDHKEHTTKRTVRYKSILKIIKSKDELWQLKINE